ncbi:hypothetical protein QQ045_028250 [Rhodiola kirilowii]
MAEFNEFQIQAGLSDASYIGNKYTWCNNQEGDAQIWTRLDRLLVNGRALAVLPDLQVHHLARVASDHCPLLISLGDNGRRRSTFKYLHIWHDHPGFLDTVTEVWQHGQHQNPIMNFTLKLKHLRQHLKKWNWDVFGNIRTQTQQLLCRISNLEDSLQTRRSNEVETELVQAKHDLQISQRQHYTILADKAKAQWLIDGDRNSTIFHAMLKAHRRFNRIMIEQEDGSLTSDRDEIGAMALQDFQARLCDYSMVPPPDAFDHIVASISEEGNLLLIATPEEDEIW